MFMSVTLYTLPEISTYTTPEEAIEGIEKETVEAAKNFSPDTKRDVEKSAKALADTARQTIFDLGTEVFVKIQKFPDTRDQEMCNAMRQTWGTAETMRHLCLNTLENGAYAETLEKVSNAKKKINRASFDQLVKKAIVAPTIAYEQPKPLSPNLRKLQQLSKLTGKFPNF
jgi:lysyl-tRNA synthetase class II